MKPCRLSLSIVMPLLPGLALAANLAPFQREALERILATMDAETQAFARPELEAMLAGMGEAEVKLVVDGMLAGAPDNPSDEYDASDPADIAASPADLDFNRRQYEPAMREAWRASKAFDDFVDSTITARCPADGTYAVFGAGWRYELQPMRPYWTRASATADQDIQILGAAYAPQDGRYRFDFSGARNDFDRAAVSTAIARACDDYRSIGDAFLVQARQGMSGDWLPNGTELEQAANQRVSPLVTALQTQLQALAPTGNTVILNALLSGTPVE